MPSFARLYSPGKVRVYVADGLNELCLFEMPFSGTVYADDETNGRCLDNSGGERDQSPAVTEVNVYVSFAWPTVKAFNAVTGQQLWHHDSCCQGGGGATPVVHGERVSVRDDFCDPTTGLVLDANTGNPIGGFDSLAPPAFIGNSFCTSSTRLLLELMFLVDSNYGVLQEMVISRQRHSL